MTAKYYYLLLSHTEFLAENGLEEVLRERANYYKNQKRQKNFWILLSPKFIENKNIQQRIEKTNFYKRLKEKNLQFTAIISMNYEFIKWIELRMGYFENISINDSNLETNARLFPYGLSGEIKLPTEQEPNFILFKDQPWQQFTNLMYK